ncbi:MAG: ATP-binding cassette subfamily C protein LapB [Candidatus Azotimanducaceae bacterium]|jgi:ATP-binding cassette subfamily C protein LapB
MTDKHSSELLPSTSQSTTRSNPQSKAGRSPDPLLLCLAYLSRFHLQPFSTESLAAGLPLDNDKLSPALFVRAAERAGFKAAIAEKPLDDISPLTLPVVVLLKDNQAAILLKKDQDRCTVVFPAESEIAQELSIDKLNEEYEGTYLLFKPEPGQHTADDTGKRSHWFWDTVKLSRGIYLEVLVASLLINLFALVSPLFIMNVYDRVVPNYAIETLWVLASGVFIIVLFDLAMKILRGYFIDIAGKRADVLLSAKTFSKVMGIRLDQRPKQIGSFANNLQEFDTFREFFTSTTLTTLIDMPFVILFLLIIYSVGGPIVFVPLVAVPLIICIGLLIQKPLQILIDDTFAYSAKKHALLIEALSSLDAIKSNRAEGVIQKRWENFTGQLARLSLKSRLLTMGAINFSQIIQQLATVGVVVVGVYLIMDGSLSVGGLIACTILTGRCLAPMGQIAGILTRYQHSVASYRSIDNMMNLPLERPDGKNFLHRTSLSGAVEFRDVTFSYTGQAAAAIKQVSFTITPGEKVGLIGKMGSGKTTIQKLCMGFHQPTEGTILLSQTDINQLDPQDVRRNAIYVSQDIQLFSGTVRENITLGAPLATDDEIRGAAKLAGLLDFINQHPEGFDLQVGERGGLLSGGQRQAVALARALINEAPLMLLDEPTSGMDSTAEMAVKQHLEQFCQDKTLLLITHKTNMLSMVNRLIVVNDGQVVADGKRDDVLKALSGGGNG